MRATDSLTFKALEEEEKLLVCFSQHMLLSGFLFRLEKPNAWVNRVTAMGCRAIREMSERTPFDSSRRIANHTWLREIRVHSDGRIAVAISFRNRWGTPLAGVTDCLEFFDTLYRMPGPVLYECVADVSTWTSTSKPVIYGQFLLSHQAFHGEIQRLHRPGDSWLKHRLAYALIDHRGFNKQRQPANVAVYAEDVQDDRYTFTVKLSGVAFPVFVDFKQGQLTFAFSEPAEKENQKGDISR